NFSKNWFYLHPEPLRPGNKLTNYCIVLTFVFWRRKVKTMIFFYQFFANLAKNWTFVKDF
ncbi:MAG: hypothetical protein E7109_09785, partial [Bacteroidales bacterium]|nr:hypothetical protein [Bacteroidales bacterium]